jgi:hypothetical protein
VFTKVADSIAGGSPGPGASVLVLGLDKES